MARKLVENDFGTFQPPPQKIWGGVTFFLVKMEEKKGCSKLPEMARKLVENDFWTLLSKQCEMEPQTASGKTGL